MPLYICSDVLIYKHCLLLNCFYFDVYFYEINNFHLVNCKNKYRNIYTYIIVYDISGSAVQ